MLCYKKELMDGIIADLSGVLERGDREATLKVIEGYVGNDIKVVATLNLLEESLYHSFAPVLRIMELQKGKENLNIPSSMLDAVLDGISLYMFLSTSYFGDKIEKGGFPGLLEEVPDTEEN